jgi:cytochrome o ubiquinol oxidase subunit I
MPRNSLIGPAIGIAGAAAGSALVWHIWWLAIVGTLAIAGAVIAGSFVRDRLRIIRADDVRKTEERWLRAVAEAHGASRDEEFTAANEGLAEVRAA